MSKLRQAVEEYLAIRRGLGFKLESQEPLLCNLAGYVERAGAARLTIELAVAWATQRSSRDPVSYSKRLSVARGFAEHTSGRCSDAWHGRLAPNDVLRGASRASTTCATASQWGPFWAGTAPGSTSKP